MIKISIIENIHQQNIHQMFQPPTDSSSTPGYSPERYPSVDEIDHMILVKMILTAEKVKRS